MVSEHFCSFHDSDCSAPSHRSLSSCSSFSSSSSSSFSSSFSSSLSCSSSSVDISTLSNPPPFRIQIKKKNSKKEYCSFLTNGTAFVDGQDGTVFFYHSNSKVPCIYRGVKVSGFDGCLFVTNKKTGKLTQGSGIWEEQGKYIIKNFKILIDRKGERGGQGGRGKTTSSILYYGIATIDQATGFVQLEKKKKGCEITTAPTLKNRTVGDVSGRSCFSNEKANAGGSPQNQKIEANSSLIHLPVTDKRPYHLNKKNDLKNHGFYDDNQYYSRYHRKYYGSNLKWSSEKNGTNFKSGYYSEIRSPEGTGYESSRIRTEREEGRHRGARSENRQRAFSLRSVSSVSCFTDHTKIDGCTIKKKRKKKKKKTFTSFSSSPCPPFILIAKDGTQIRVGYDSYVVGYTLIWSKYTRTIQHIGTLQQMASTIWGENPRSSTLHGCIVEMAHHRNADAKKEKNEQKKKVESLLLSSNQEGSSQGGRTVTSGIKMVDENYSDNETDDNNDASPSGRCHHRGVTKDCVTKKKKKGPNYENYLKSTESSVIQRRDPTSMISFCSFSPSYSNHAFSDSQILPRHQAIRPLSSKGNNRKEPQLHSPSHKCHHPKPSLNPSRRLLRGVSASISPRGDITIFSHLTLRSGLPPGTALISSDGTRVYVAPKKTVVQYKKKNIVLCPEQIIFVKKIKKEKNGLNNQTLQKAYHNRGGHNNRCSHCFPRLSNLTFDYSSLGSVSSASSISSSSMYLGQKKGMMTKSSSSACFFSVEYVHYREASIEICNGEIVKFKDQNKSRIFPPKKALVYIAIDFGTTRLLCNPVPPYMLLGQVLIISSIGPILIFNPRIAPVTIQTCSEAERKDEGTKNYEMLTTLPQKMVRHSCDKANRFMCGYDRPGNKYHSSAYYCGGENESGGGGGGCFTIFQKESLVDSPPSPKTTNAHWYPDEDGEHDLCCKEKEKKNKKIQHQQDRHPSKCVSLDENNLFEHCPHSTVSHNTSAIRRCLPPHLISTSLMNNRSGFSILNNNPNKILFVEGENSDKNSNKCIIPLIYHNNHTLTFRNGIRIIFHPKTHTLQGRSLPGLLFLKPPLGFEDLSLQLKNKIQKAYDSYFEKRNQVENLIPSIGRPSVDRPFIDRPAVGSTSNPLLTDEQQQKKQIKIKNKTKNKNKKDTPDAKKDQKPLHHEGQKDIYRGEQKNPIDENKENRGIRKKQRKRNDHCCSPDTYSKENSRRREWRRSSFCIIDTTNQKTTLPIKQRSLGGISDESRRIISVTIPRPFTTCVKTFSEGVVHNNEQPIGSETFFHDNSFRISATLNRDECRSFSLTQTVNDNGPSPSVVRSEENALVSPPPPRSHNFPILNISHSNNAGSHTNHFSTPNFHVRTLKEQTKNHTTIPSCMVVHSTVPDRVVVHSNIPDMVVRTYEPVPSSISNKDIRYGGDPIIKTSFVISSNIRESPKNSSVISSPLKEIGGTEKKTIRTTRVTHKMYPVQSALKPLSLTNGTNISSSTTASSSALQSNPPFDENSNPAHVFHYADHSFHSINPALRHYCKMNEDDINNGAIQQQTVVASKIQSCSSSTPATSIDVGTIKHYSSTGQTSMSQRDDPYCFVPNSELQEILMGQEKTLRSQDKRRTIEPLLSYTGQSSNFTSYCRHTSQFMESTPVELNDNHMQKTTLDPIESHPKLINCNKNTTPIPRTITPKKKRFTSYSKSSILSNFRGGMNKNQFCEFLNQDQNDIHQPYKSCESKKKSGCLFILGGKN